MIMLSKRKTSVNINMPQREGNTLTKDFCDEKPRDKEIVQAGTTATAVQADQRTDAIGGQ